VAQDILPSTSSRGQCCAPPRAIAAGHLFLSGLIGLSFCSLAELTDVLKEVERESRHTFRAYLIRNDGRLGGLAATMLRSLFGMGLAFAVSGPAD
jgi:hypothetical protein